MDFAVEGESVDSVEAAVAAAAAAELLVVSPVAVVFEPLRPRREVPGTSASPEGFQVATSLHLLQDSAVSLKMHYCHRLVLQLHCLTDLELVLHIAASH